MNALVEQTSFGITTSSRTVAEVFVKDHQNVLRDIDVMLKRRPDLCGLKFEATSVDVPMPKGGVRQIRAYEMNRDGFTLLAMGFTGEEALDWKLTFLDAFNRMEEELARRAELDGAAADSERVPMVVLPLHEIARGMAVVGEYRRIFGLAAARWMIGQLGLPIPPSEICGLLPCAPGPMRRWPAGPTPTTVSDWLEECTVREAEEKTPASELYRNFLEWCAEAHRAAETQRSFGDALARLGFDRFKSNSGHIWRRGLKLVE